MLNKIFLLLLLINAQYLCAEEHLLSFIMPAYNRAHTIEEALDSILLDQKNLRIPYEVIVCDDCSTDQTPKILKKYAQQFSNFRWYRHKKNSGASKARNTCIKNAKGDLIFNLDSDNILEKNSIQPLVNLLDKSGCQAASFAELRYFKKNKKREYSHLCKKNRYSIFDISGDNTIPSGGNYLFTRKSYQRAGGYKGRVLETWRFGFRQLATGTTIAILPNSWYWHRISSDSKWKQMQKQGRNETAALTTLQKFPEVFTPATNITFKNYNTKKRKLFTDFKTGKFKFISKKAIECLFNAYDLQDDGRIDDAIAAYKMAIKYGCSAPIIERKIARLYKKKEASGETC